MNDLGYASYREWKGWRSSQFGNCDTNEALYYRHEMARCGIIRFSGTRVLEIGFGNGSFAAWVAQQGANYVGVEMIEELVLQGRANGYEVHLAGKSLSAAAQDGTLDIVAAWDVFEHMEIDELKSLLVDVERALRPGGLVVARVPSGDSPFSLAIQNGDLTHRAVLGSSAIRQLATETGFEVIQVREPALPLLGQGLHVWLRRSLVTLARYCLFPFIRYVFMDGGTPVLSPNMIFALRKPAYAD